MAKYGFTFDPFELTGVKVPAKNRSDALEAVGNYLLEAALSNIGKGVSPVKDGPWKKSLEPEYKDKKKEESSVTIANLELTGDLLDALNVKKEGQKKLFYGVDSSEAGKAEGNNIGSYGQPSGDEGKARRFIPIAGETFKPSIIAGMRSILEEYADEA